jgi:hypothetical protein
MGEGEIAYTELAMVTVEHAIELAGLVLGSGACDPKSISITLEEMIRVFDVAEHSLVTLSISTADNDQGIVYYSTRLVPRSVRFEWDPEIGFHNVILECQGEGLQLPAIEKPQPGGTEPPIEPPIEPPVEPPLPPVIPPPPPPSTGTAKVVAATASDVRTSADFDQASPTWSTEL